jgi:hypothetical protein
MQHVSELKRHEICNVFSATLLNSTAALVSHKQLSARRCSFHHGFVNMHQKCSNFHQHKIPTFITRSMKPRILFPAFQATNYKPITAPIRYLRSTTFLICEILSTATADTWRRILSSCTPEKYAHLMEYLLLSFFHWHYSPLWALACRTISFHFSLSVTNSLHHR